MESDENLSLGQKHKLPARILPLGLWWSGFRLGVLDLTSGYFRYLNGAS